MGFKDYFNNDDNDDEDYEEEEEYIPEDREIKLGDKVFKSIIDFKQNATDEELESYYNQLDKSIIKTEKKLSFANFAFKIFVGLGIAGGVLMFVKGAWTGTLKNVMDYLAPISFTAGTLFAGLNWKRYLPVEADLDYYYYAFDEVDEEIYQRTEKEKLDTAGKEIFIDIYEEEKE